MRSSANWLETWSLAESVDFLRDLALLHLDKVRSGPLRTLLVAAVQRDDMALLCNLNLDYGLLAESDGDRRCTLECSFVLNALKSAAPKTAKRFSELGEGLEGSSAVNLDWSQGAYTSAEVYHLRQALGFFSKLEDLDIGEDKRWNAVLKFFEAEGLCGETNEIYRLRRQGKFHFLPRVETILSRAAQLVASVTGYERPAWRELGYRFGKGATTLTRKRMASLREKFAAGLSCSEDLVPAASAILGELPELSKVWADAYIIDDDQELYSIQVAVHDGKVEFVPKNAKTYRATVTEPVLNGLFQLAVGDHLVPRLARVGVFLRDQSRNQRLARKGSIDGSLATVDLSSASDTVALEAVYDLLPLEWAAFLRYGRTGHVRLSLSDPDLAVKRRQKVVYERLTLEKFSSMGNGFTFALESLIFWALARAVIDEAIDQGRFSLEEAGASSISDVLAVYGDDIILPSKLYHEFVEVLTAVGFLPNMKKSFFAGPFRESCGADWYFGDGVRPYYQKKLVSGQTLFVLHNFYVRNGLSEFAAKVRGFIHPSLLIFGPDGYGDGHLLGDHQRRRQPRHERNGVAGYFFDTFTTKPRRDTRPAKPSDCVLPSYSVYMRGSRDTDEGWAEMPRPSFEAERLLNQKFDGGSMSRERYLHFFRRSHGSFDDQAGIPNHELEDGSVVKATDFPVGDEDSYKKLTIYTLGA